MNKLIIVLLLLFILFSPIYCAEKEKNEESIKRTIMILPFLNKNNVEEYAYLAETMRDALKAKLLDTEQFQMTNFNTIDTKIDDFGFSNEETQDEKNAKSLAIKLKADVIITGKYIIIEDKIMIQIDAFDIFNEQSVASTNIRGELGLDIFRIIDESAEDMSGKLKRNLKEVKKSYFTEMTALLKKERLLKLKDNFTVPNKVGIGLTAGGGTLFIAGLSLMIFDFSYYSNELQDNLYNNPRTDAGYNEYVTAYYTYTGMLAAGITSLCLGATMTAAGIPLIIYKKKNKKISMNFGPNNSLNIEICLKL